MSDAIEYRNRKLKIYGKVLGYQALTSAWAPIIAVAFGLSLFFSIKNNSFYSIYSLIMDVAVFATALLATFFGKDADATAWYSCVSFIISYTVMQAIQLAGALFADTSPIDDLAAAGNAPASLFSTLTHGMLNFSAAITVLILIVCAFYIYVFIKHRKFFFASIKQLRIERFGAENITANVSESDT